MPSLLAPSPNPELTGDVLDLPEGWLPDEVLLFAVGEFDPAENRWEVMLPFWSIAGIGQSLHDAFDEAEELLLDYFRMCAAEGRPYAQSYRPLPKRWLLPMLARAVGHALWRKFNKNEPPRQRLLRAPLGHAHC